MIKLYNMSLVNVCRAEIYFRSSGKTANLEIDLDKLGTVFAKT